MDFRPQLKGQKNEFMNQNDVCIFESLEGILLSLFYKVKKRQQIVLKIIMLIKLKQQFQITGYYNNYDRLGYNNFLNLNQFSEESTIFLSINNIKISLNQQLLQSNRQDNQFDKMQNFHFNPSNNRSVHLIKQLQQIDKQLQIKRKQLQMKKLQDQFYQDSDYVKQRNSNPIQNYPSNSQNNNYNYQNNNYGLKNNDVPIKNNNFTSQKDNPSKKNNNLNLADQIMNQLLNDNKSKNIQKQNYIQKNQFSSNKEPSNQINNYSYNQRNDNPNNLMYQNLNNFNNPQSNPQENPSNKFNYQNFKKNQYSANKEISSPPANNFHKNAVAPHQNNFINQNKRQMEKQKLQNASSHEQNPFVPRTQPVKKSVDQKYQKPIVNERQLQKMKLQQQAAQNPFWSNQNRNLSRQKSNNNRMPLQAFQNIRQKQKQKLQQKLYNNNDYDLYKRPNSPPQIPAQRDDIQQNISKKAAFQNRYSNPFVKDQQYIKQKREQQQRQYRKALEQQKKIQQQRKKLQKQMVKQEKYAFNAYQPGTNNLQSGNKPIAQVPKSIPLNMTKKVDPNGKPPVYNYDQISNKNISASDLNYMRMKANQLKESYKKGRILHDEYVQQVRKLADYYNVDYKELMDKKNSNDNSEQLPWIKQAKKKQQQVKSSNPSQTTIKKYDQNSKYQIIQNQQSLQKIPDSQTSLRNNQFYQEPSSPSKNNNIYSGPNISTQQQSYLHFGQYVPNNNIYTQNLSNNGMNPQSYGLGATSFMQQFPQMDYDLMRKMFEQLKAMRSDYTKSLQNQKMFLQQTFMKFVNNQMMAQQQQFNNNYSGNQVNQDQRNGQNKKMAQFSPKPKKNQKNLFSESSQQQLTDQSMDYIQKSLSGIVNKIPFYSNSTNRNAKEHSYIGGSIPQQKAFSKKNNQPKQINRGTQTIQQFYQKPYKVKKFKKFSIMVDITQSSMEIPNVSNFLALKNGKDVLNRLFQQDLLTMKKLQRQKEVQKLRNRVDNQLSYGNYGDTFSAAKNTDSNSLNVAKKSSPKKQQLVYFNSKQTQQIIVTQQSHYQEYENYSREKNNISRDSRSNHQQNHRSYKKSQNQSLPQSAFIKRHISNNEQNLPNFADQSDIKVRSPVYYSPKLNSQILEQDEYQTAQKSTNQQLLESEFYGSSIGNKLSPQMKESTNKKYQMRKKDFAYEQQRPSQKKKNSRQKQKSPTFRQDNSKDKLANQKSNGNAHLGGIMNIIKSNNQVLSKYQKNINDYSPKKQEVDIKDYSSINSNIQDEELKNYFSSGQNEGRSINNGQNYQQPPLVLGYYNGNNQKNSQLNSNITQKSNQYGYQKSQQQLSDKFNSQKYNTNQINIHNQQYEESLQTVRSEEDHILSVKKQQNKYISNNKANLNNKYSPQSNSYYNEQEDYLNSHQSNGQRQMKHSVASSNRAPASVNISQTVQSYEQSSSRMVRPPLNKKRSSSRKKQSSIIRTKFQKDSILQKPPHQNSRLRESDSDLIDSQPIKFDSNVYQSEYQQSIGKQEHKQLQTKIMSLQNQQAKSREQKDKSPVQQITINPPVIVTPKSGQNNESKVSLGGGKLKSLQQARNLAKQCKKKSISSTQNQFQKYEQKMSQLQSFLTRKDQSILKQSRQTKMIKLGIQKSPAKNSNKNIMNLLDELENQSSYKEDFESYRQESERFN